MLLILLKLFWSTPQLSFRDIAITKVKFLQSLHGTQFYCSFVFTRSLCRTPFGIGSSYHRTVIIFDTACGMWDNKVMLYMGRQHFGYWSNGVVSPGHWHFVSLSIKMSPRKRSGSDVMWYVGEVFCGRFASIVCDVNIGWRSCIQFVSRHARLCSYINIYLLILSGFIYIGYQSRTFRNL